MNHQLTSVAVESLPETDLMPDLRELPQADLAPISKPAKPRPAEQGSLFRVVWRWHFYAGAFVTPFLITLAVTGALYIFKSEIEYLCRSEMLSVSVPDAPRMTYQSQVDAVKAAFPDYQIGSVTIPPEINRSTAIQLRKAGPPPEPGRRGPREGLTVYVNPYSNAVLGQIGTGNDQLGPFFRFTLTLHRNLFIGTTGRVITELVTSWTVILLLTGTYLWIPKQWSRRAGVWVPRWTKKRYTLLRDLHSVSGIYLMPIMLTIAVTGMFYTFAVGKVIHDAAHYVMEDPETPPPAQQNRGQGQGENQRAIAQGDQRNSANSDRPQRGERGNNPEMAQALPLGISLDQIVEIARREYPNRIISANLGPQRRGQNADPKAISVGAGNDFNATYGRMVNTNMSLDRQSGAILSRKHLSEGGHFWHGWTYPLHVGSIYGPATKVLWLMACLVLLAMPVTGLWMWWERRPQKAWGLPRRQQIRLPKWLIALIAATCLLFPIAGASILLIMAIEGLVHLVRRIRRKPVAAI